MVRRAVARIVVGLVLTTAFSSPSHVILDPELVRRLMVEIAQASKESREGSDTEGEALYRLGEKVEQLVELMNQDISSHGGSDPLAQLVLKRLETYQIKVAFSERNNRFDYDLAAFREYISRAPKGRRSAGARFRLLARTFYQTLAPEPSQLANEDVPIVQKAIAEEEGFLKQYEGDVKTKEVRFFLAVDYYRLYKNVHGPDQVVRYERLARRTLEEVKARYPGSIEGRAAEALLDNLRHP
jgi:TolA-binding protein